MAQKAFWVKFFRLFIVFFGMVNMPDVHEDSSPLGDAMAVIDIVLGGSVGNRLRGDRTPAVNLLCNILVLSVPFVFMKWLYLVPKRLRIL